MIFDRRLMNGKHQDGKLAIDHPIKDRSSSI